MTETQMLYARLASIRGTFARHITAVVATSALGQLTIAALIAARGTLVVLGVVGAIVFLLSIASLGIGSGFPSTLIMALAAAALFRTRADRLVPAARHPLFILRDARAGERG